LLGLVLIVASFSCSSRGSVSFK